MPFGVYTVPLIVAFCADARVTRNGSTRNKAAIESVNALKWLQMGANDERRARTDGCIFI